MTTPPNITKLPLVTQSMCQLSTIYHHIVDLKNLPTSHCPLSLRTMIIPLEVHLAALKP